MASRATETLSLGELASATGVPAETLLDWVGRGIFAGDGVEFPHTDIERVRLVRFAVRRGNEPAAIAVALNSQPGLLSHWVEAIAEGGVRVGRSLDHVADDVGFDRDQLGRLWIAMGLGDQNEAYDEDVAALRGLDSAIAAGLPEEAAAQLMRVFADSLGRVAEAEERLFHFYVHERLRAEGVAGEALGEATRAVGDPLRRMIEPAVLYFHRKAHQRALREHFLLHLALDSADPTEARARMTGTILFADLSGFTPMTEAMGDAAAADVVERFAALVRDLAHRHNGRVVKQIGDEFMVRFNGATDAVGFGVDLESASAQEPHFPAVRVGAHTGDALYRDGDYVGANVNLAARVTAQARGHQFVVTAAVRDAAGTPADAEFVALGARTLKGIADPVELFEVRPTGTREHRPVDPVCLMQIDPESCGIRLAWRGTELYFCSDDCLRRFVDAQRTSEAPHERLAY